MQGKKESAECRSAKCRVMPFCSINVAQLETSRVEPFHNKARRQVRTACLKTGRGMRCPALRARGRCGVHAACVVSSSGGVQVCKQQQENGNSHPPILSMTQRRASIRGRNGGVVAPARKEQEEITSLHSAANTRRRSGRVRHASVHRTHARHTAQSMSHVGTDKPLVVICTAKCKIGEGKVCRHQKRLCLRYKRERHCVQSACLKSPLKVRIPRTIAFTE